MKANKKKARSAVGAAKQAAGSNLGGQVPVNKYNTGSFEFTTPFYGGAA